MIGKTEKYFFAKITLKLKVNPYTAKEIWVGTDSAEEGALYTSSPKIYPILVGVNGLSTSMGTVLPNDKTGSFQIDVTRGTIKWDLRLMDLLETHVIINQDIIFYSFEKQVGQVGDVADRDTEFSGKVSSFAVDNSVNVATIEVKSESLSNDTPMETTTDNASSGNRGVGQYLPLVFGSDVQVLGHRVSNDGAATVQHEYATNFTNFKVGGVQNYYIKNNPDLEGDSSSNNYKAVKSATSTTTAAMANDAADTGAVEIIDESAMWTAHNSATENYLITHVRFLAYGKDDASVILSGTFVASIYEGISNVYGAGPGRLIARGTRIASQYQGLLRGAAEFNIDIALTNIAPLINSNGYWIAFHHERDSGSSLGLAYNEAMGFTNYVRVSNANYWVLNGSLNKDIIWSLFGVKLTDNNTALPANIELTQPTLLSGPSLDNLDFLLEVDGLKDDTSGTITGSAGSLIDKTDEIVKFLYYKQNGDSLTGLDNSTYTDPNFADYNIAGATDGEVTYKEIISEILKESAAKLIPQRDGDLALYGYGETLTSSVEVSESDIVIQGFEIEGLGDIINAATALYDKVREPLNVEDLQSVTGFSNYTKTVSLYYGSDATTDALTLESFNLYGTQKLGSQYQFFNWIKDENFVKMVLRSFFATNGLERMVFTVRVPYWKNSYRSIQLYNKIEVTHIDTPQASGTNSSSISNAHAWRRANTYDMRIISRKPIFNVGSEEPEIEWKLRVLDDSDEVH